MAGLRPIVVNCVCWIGSLAALSLPWIYWVSPCDAGTVALWLFDEQQDLYPSCVLGDASSGRFPLVIGTGGRIVEGKFGNALEPRGRRDAKYPLRMMMGEIDIGGKLPLLDSQTDKQTITWWNAHYAALMTCGERQLRKEVSFGSPTDSALNLGATDWTVEFWYRPEQSPERSGVVFEIGIGPLGSNHAVTRLSLNEDAASFNLRNDAGDVHLRIESDPQALNADRSEWHHYAFVYGHDEQQLRHYVDGKLQALPNKAAVQSLPVGEDDYMTVGRGGHWQHRLPGRLDELRISDNQVYEGSFDPPGSFSKYGPEYVPPPLKAGPPLLFGDDLEKSDPVQLGNRKHVFLDDALIADSANVEFHVNPPRMDEAVFEKWGLNNHLVVFEDVDSGDGLVRLYARGPQQSLAVWTSEDGVHFTSPDLGREFQGARNVVIEDPVGLGTMFIDPNAPAEERIKYVSGYRGRAIFVYSSPDGYHFTRNETSALPFRGASQSIVYYDEQRQEYVGYHRSDMLRSPGGKTIRSSVMTETTDLMRPWPLNPLSHRELNRLAKSHRLGWKIPYYVDNGPLTPPGFGVEYPIAFKPDESFDPVGVDIYVPKCIKYPWAPDAYLAFPVMYFHYQGDGPPARRALGRPDAGRGSGPLETQLSVSRDGLKWKRYPRPTYVGIGRHAGLDLKKAYMGHGMVRRGEEIWQYFVGSEQYHSPWTKDHNLREAYIRVVQRLDGFVSADTPYTGGELTSRPLVFAGNRLILNIDTDATGYAQVGLLDEEGSPIEGYAVDDCIYINGDFTDAEVEWLNKGKDLSELAGQTVHLVIRSRGTKLYSLQFVER